MLRASIVRLCALPRLMLTTSLEAGRVSFIEVETEEIGSDLQTAIKQWKMLRRQTDWYTVHYLPTWCLLILSLVLICSVVLFVELPSKPFSVVSFEAVSWCSFSHTSHADSLTPPCAVSNKLPFLQPSTAQNLPPVLCSKSIMSTLVGRVQI